MYRHLQFWSGERLPVPPRQTGTRLGCWLRRLAEAFDALGGTPRAACETQALPGRLLRAYDVPQATARPPVAARRCGGRSSELTVVGGVPSPRDRSSPPNRAVGAPRPPGSHRPLASTRRRGPADFCPANRPENDLSYPSCRSGFMPRFSAGEIPSRHKAAPTARPTVQKSAVAATDARPEPARLRLPRPV